MAPNYPAVVFHVCTADRLYHALAVLLAEEHERYASDTRVPESNAHTDCAADGRPPLQDYCHDILRVHGWVSARDQATML